ncbi:MAG TPA: DUF2784 domain-containing protein [Terriglobales bacterium]|nr:DUF2784 domain-containing protein [Terriglobales bacterium]
MRFYYVLACAVMAVHALFIIWVILGAIVTGRHPLLRWLHIVSLFWGVWIEAGPWPCPLTWAENWLEVRAGVNSYQGSFLLHYLDRFVYPNISPFWLTEAAVVVAIFNLGVYARRYYWARRKS